MIPKPQGTLLTFHSQSELIILPVDLVIPSTLPLTHLLNTHRSARSPLVTSLFFEKPKDHLLLPSGKMDKSAEGEKKWYVTYEKESGAFLGLRDTEKEDEDDEEIEVRMSLLWK